MSQVSLCKTYHCPFWSNGHRSEPGAPIGGYGCKRYSVALQCLASNVAGVTASEYELFVDNGGSPNKSTLIALAISHVVFRDIDEDHQV